MSLSRNDLINLNIYTEYKKTKSLLYKNNLNVDDPTNYSDLVRFNFEDLLKLDKCVKSRRYNYKIEMLKWLFYIQEIEFISPKKLIFITLTFDDYALSNIQKKYRRVYVERFLKDQCLKYIANIDYGKEGREHYHAIALVDKYIDCSKWKWIINVQIIPTEAKDQLKVNKYILKLNNHSFKDSTKQERLIKDRNKDLDSKIDYFVNTYNGSWRNFKIKFKVDSYL